MQAGVGDRIADRDTRTGRGVGILAGVLALVVFGPYVAPYSPTEFVGAPYSGISDAAVLGTDNLGRDYLSRLIYGAQISLLIGVCTALLSGIIGSALGVTAGGHGFHGGWALHFSIPWVNRAFATLS